MKRRHWLLIKALEGGMPLSEALKLAKEAEAFLDLDDLAVPVHKQNGSVMSNGKEKT
jgi:hypothetical protein